MKQIRWGWGAALVASVVWGLAGCAQGPASLSGGASPLPIPPDSLAAECPSEIRYEPLSAVPSDREALQQHVALRLSALGLEAAWQGQWSEARARAFEATPEDMVRLRRLAMVVLPALERYDPAVFKRVGLRQVVLVKDLAVAGQLRLAMPAAEQQALVLGDHGRAVCAAGLELRVHHELYHLIEHALFGDFYYRDPAWLALNPERLTYGSGGASAYQGRFDNLGHPEPGLVSRYAGTGPEEDKAEMLGWLMTPGYAGRLRGWAAQDHALAAKRRFMMALMHRLSAGSMSEAAFDRLAQMH